MPRRSGKAPARIGVRLATAPLLLAAAVLATARPAAAATVEAGPRGAPRGVEVAPICLSPTGCGDGAHAPAPSRAAAPGRAKPSSRGKAPSHANRSSHGTSARRVPVPHASAAAGAPRATRPRSTRVALDGAEMKLVAAGPAHLGGLDVAGDAIVAFYLVDARTGPDADCQMDRLAAMRRQNAPSLAGSGRWPVSVEVPSGAVQCATLAAGSGATLVAVPGGR